MKIFFLIPILNEEKNIADLTQAILNQVKDVNDIEPTVFFVDDGSTDESWSILNNLKQEGQPVSGISFSRNFGKENALMEGVVTIKDRCDAAIILDADFQHPPELIPEIITRWRETGTAVVDAVKSNRGKESILYKIFAKTFYSFINAISGLDLQNSSDFKLLDKKVLNDLSTLNENNVFFRGLIGWIGHSSEKVLFKVDERADGDKGLTLAKRISLALTILTSTSTAPLQIVTKLSLFFMFGSFVLGAQSLYMKISGNALDGFTTVILLQLIIGSCVLFGLGIIGQYLAKIYLEIKRRPRAVIKSSI